MYLIKLHITYFEFKTTFIDIENREIHSFGYLYYLFV